MKSGMALLPTENSECLRTQLGSRIRSRTGYIICGIGIVLTGTRTKSPTSNSPKRKGAQRRLASRGRGQLKSHCLTDASLCAQRRLASRGRGLAKRLKLEVWAFRAQRRLASRGRGRPCWRPRQKEYRNPHHHHRFDGAWFLGNTFSPPSWPSCGWYGGGCARTNVRRHPPRPFPF